MRSAQSREKAPLSPTIPSRVRVSRSALTSTPGDSDMACIMVIVSSPKHFYGPTAAPAPTSMNRLVLAAVGVFVANPPVGHLNPSAGVAIISSFTDPAKLLQREHKKSSAQAGLRWARGTPWGLGRDK
jgi:hypothetical protein